jgi:hypothetical protein
MIEVNLRRLLSLVILSLFLLPILAAQEAPKRGAVEGVVEDEAGQPITGAVVRAIPESVVTRVYAGFPVQLGIMLNPSAVTTGNNGSFAVENLGTGRSIVEVSREGYAPASVLYDLSEGQRLKNIKIPMSPVGVISGRVFDKNGMPAVDVFVTPLYYYTVKGHRELVRGQATRTNDRGEYRLGNLRRTSYFLVFAAQGGPPPKRGDGPPSPLISTPLPQGPIIQRLVPEGEPGVTEIQTPLLYPGVSNLSLAEAVELKDGNEIRLRDVTMGSTRLGKVDVRLRNSPGESPKDIEVVLTYRTPRGPGDPNMILGASRILRLDAAPLETTYWPNLPGIFDVEVRWGPRLSPRVQPSARLSGGVLDDRLGVVKTFEYTGADMQIDLTVTDEQGRLTVRGLEEQQGGTLSPLKQGPTIMLCPQQSPCWSIFANITGALDSQGTLTQFPVPSGKYDLASISLPLGVYLASARQGDRDALTEGVKVAKDAAPLELRFRSGGATVLGSVRDQQGQPLPNSLVALLPDLPSTSRFDALTPSTRTDQNGSFVLTGIIPAKYSAFAWPADMDSGVYLDSELLSRMGNRGRQIIATEGQEIAITLGVESKNSR